ncbi:carboxypeptidase B-like isoform X2 [Trichoplusia ni]|uniref:Carboxypeptidase B-like isoform X2 n=1 Tax=Trichoplusia ni TaxID=7111 RepID=A0A7E5WV87_TRINI|nr:carboxypeptidase B-like isoform X2 [Trichoplusia ni]
MSVILKSARPRRVKSTMQRQDLFYIYDDRNESSESDQTECADGSTQTKLNKRRRSPATSLKNIITPRRKLKKRKVRFMDWKKYHRLSVIYSFIDELERDFPAICTVSVIGKSVEGRDIKMLKISNSNANNSAVWLDACIHPREWISTAVVTYIADVLVRNFHTFSTSITNKDWHIIPVLNPDGYEYTHTGERMWRKNRACYGGECVGVDLNRNFSYAWGQSNGEQGSSDEPTHVFYRGPAPFSEPETVAVRDTILGSVTPFKVFLSFHSYFELIIFPWGNRKDPCPDYLHLLEAGTIMAIHETSGKTYKVGSTKDLTYYACGTSIDWSYSIAKIPYSFMVELRSRKHKFRLPKEQIMENCVEIWNAVIKLMEYVDQH